MSAQPEPFSGRLVVGLIAVGLAAFAALLLIYAFGGQSATSRDGRAHPLSVSGTGFKALATLTARFNRTSRIYEARDFDTASLVIVAIEQDSRPADLARLLDRRRGRPTLIILPKWFTEPDRARRGWVRAISPGAGMRAARLIDPSLRASADFHSGQAGTARGADRLAGIAVPQPRIPQTIDGGKATPLLAGPGGGALIAQLGDQPHYVAADPDLFNNHGLRDPGTARAALAILARLKQSAGDGIAFDLTVNGMGDNARPNLLRTALEPPFLPMILALLAAALLAGLHGAFRFGQARSEPRSIALGKAALVENSAGLIKLARRETRLGGAYADVVRHDTARLTGAPPTLQSEALDLYLDRLSKDGPSFSALARQLGEARSRHELVAAARALFSWKKDIIS